jgi:DNA-binding GntR family transcriptional regulator
MSMASHGILEFKSLREQVYEYLRVAINRGELHPGSFLDQRRLSESLGISKTPLRDALIQLETEGFVSILPRRGVLVNRLALDDIRHLYEIIGALEGVTVVAVADRLDESRLETMWSLNTEMVQAIAAGDFDTYYDRNLAFHDVFLGLSDNTPLLRTVENSKHRLYDFPRRRDFLPDWEIASTREHAAFVDLLAAGDARGAADYMRDVHWSFEVQRPFIRRYYFPDAAEAVAAEV